MKLCILVFCLIGLAVALPSETFNKQQTVQILQSHKAENIVDAYYVVQALQALKETPNNKKAFCDLANEELSKATDLKSVYFATFVAEDLNCAKRANEKVAALIFKSPSGETVEDLYFGTMAAFRLRAKKHLSFDTKIFHEVISSLSDLTAIDGTVKNSMGDARGTFFHSGLAFQIAAVIAEAGDLSSDQELVLSIFKENVEGLLELSTETDEGVLFVDSRDSKTSFRGTSSLLQGAFDILSDDLDILLEADILDDITSQILSSVPTGNIKEIFYFAKMMSLITSGKVPTTQVLGLEKTTFSSSVKNDGNVVVTVTDLLGNAVPGVNVFLMKASSFSDDTVIYSNQELKKLNAKEFSFNFFASKPSQGFYYIEFGVQTDKKSPIRSTYRTIKVVTSVSVGQISLDISDTSDKEILQSLTASTTKPFSSVKATYFNGLSFSFTLKNQATNKPTRIQQASFRFESGESEASFPAKFDAETYSLYLNMKDVGRDLLFASGDYEISLILGDAFIDNSSMFTLGTINLNFPPSLQVTAHESVYSEKPEIEHTFRVPDKRPAEAVSFAFTIGVLSPIAILLIGFLATGLSIKFPSGLAFIFSILFLGSIYAIFLSYTGFWLGQYNMFQTLQYLGILSVFAFFFGNRTLRAKAAARTAEIEKQKPKTE